LKTIFFSVVLTSYNSEKYLKKTLESLLNQRLKKFEVILVDDGSKDNTLKIAKIYQNYKNFKLKIIKLRHSGSPARSRNIGIMKSKGDYVCFLDADDLFLKNKFFYLNKIIQKKNFDVFYHNVILKHKKKNLFCKKIDTNNSLEDLLLKGNKIVLSSSCIKRSFLIKKKIRFNENRKLISVEDYDFWLQIAKLNGRFLLISKILGTYNLNDSSISRKRYNHFLNTMYLIKQYKRYLNKNKMKYYIRKLRIILSFIKVSIIENNFHFFTSLLKYMITSKKIN
jgi:teichuronic acid biosynthesis glycosyltransferase TuaG